MVIKWFLLVLILTPWALKPICVRAEEPQNFTRAEDVIYGRKFGTALTLDVFTPKENAKGLAAVFIISGGWTSGHEFVSHEGFASWLASGYTCFAVVHGSQPKYTIPEVIQDIHRAIRFIRFHANDYGVDPNRIALAGSSAGGHLALTVGMSGTAGDANAKDPVERESSRVQAVACFFGPTDFLNYGQTGRDFEMALQEELAPFKAPFDFTEWDIKSGRYVLITDKEKKLEIAKQISPITHVTEDDPPTYIIHGDKDPIVPIQQSESMKAALEAVKVPVVLDIRKGQGHGWEGWLDDLGLFAEWFDQHLQKAK